MSALRLDWKTIFSLSKTLTLQQVLDKYPEVFKDGLGAMDVIQPVQFSDWAAPVVPVRKSDGRVRLCGDYKITVNRAAKLDRYPIPRIEELFTSLAGGKAFSKLDLSQAYLQIPLDVESRRYVTINIHRSLFEYKRLPFGVASAPSIFQRVMETSCKVLVVSVSTSMISSSPGPLRVNTWTIWRMSCRGYSQLE